MPATQTSGKAIASLILGISSFFCMFFTGIAAIVFGALALSDIKNKPKRLGGSGLAIAGIVTGILGCLWTVVAMIALLLPAVQQVREAARMTMSMNNMRQMTLAMHNYESAFKEFPSAFPDPQRRGSQLSWRVQILPFIEQSQLYEEFHQDEPWDSEHNLTLIDRMPEIYTSLSHELEPGKTMYLVPTSLMNETDPVAQMNSAIFVQGKRTRFETIGDGTSNTILMVEADPGAAVIWTKPDDLSFDPDNPMNSLGNARPGKFLAAFADGSVKPIETSISPQQLKALFTARAGDDPGQGIEY